jgi:hypothetical protein
MYDTTESCCWSDLQESGLVLPKGDWDILEYKLNITSLLLSMQRLRLGILDFYHFLLNL